ncbi:choice-of-anchor M domain-containing protein [Saccharothrix sp.]|uniref:choice-of-anchor M domain-containing protein n=1 Tax=Saccharothrix sp. TaxID=1873460 RepID=UPI0028113C11|nr:choice-of-anchor M domain-containing protein [Saccharothrix sp.]
MTPTRTAALLGVAAALLITTPTATAEPTPRVADAADAVDAVLDVENGALALEPRPDQPTSPDQPAPADAVEVAAGAERVELRWDTTGIEPGTVFGDAVRLRASVVESAPVEPAPVDAAPVESPADEPVVVPVASSGTLELDALPAGEHLLRVEATAHTLDGTPLTATRDYPVSVAAAPKAPDVPEALPQTPAVAAPQPRIEAAAQQPPTATGRVTLNQGHVDAVAPRLLPDGLHVQVKDGTATGVTTWREPADVEFRVPAAARTELPAQPALSFLGNAGKQVFLLPQTQRTDLLWTGWNTEELRPADVSGAVTWRLTAVDGPGPFGLFTTGSFGAPEVIFNSVDGLPDTLSVPLGTHAHANWAFAEPGRYRLTFAVDAQAADGRPLTDTETFTFVVGDGGQAQQPGGTDRQTGTPSRLASTGPAALPATTGLALALIVTGTAVLVLTRRRPAKENP